jgi:hypothetical protein
LRHILFEMSTRMGTITLAVAVFEANSVKRAVKPVMKKLVAIVGQVDKKCSLEASHTERPKKYKNTK